MLYKWISNCNGCNIQMDIWWTELRSDPRETVYEHGSKTSFYEWNCCTRAAAHMRCLRRLVSQDRWLGWFSPVAWLMDLYQNSAWMMNCWSRIIAWRRCFRWLINRDRWLGWFSPLTWLMDLYQHSALNNELLIKDHNTNKLFKTTGKSRSLIGMIFPTDMADGFIPAFRIE